MCRSKVIGVEPCDANKVVLSLHHRKRVRLNRVGSFGDGVAVKVVGDETFPLYRNLVDGVVLVKHDSICASIKVNLQSFSSRLAMKVVFPYMAD